jgi:Tol biopolymer transport system component
MKESPSSNDRLDSWKEIATYLNRTERTVSRWEKRGLPVHRVPGGQKQAVFAFKHELDAWLLQGKQPNAELELASEANGLSNISEEAEAPALISPTIATQPILDEPPQFIEESSFSNETYRSRRITIRHFVHTYRTTIAIIVSLLSLLTVIGFRTALFHSTATIRIGLFHKITEDGRLKVNLVTDGSTLYFNEFEANREVIVASSTAGGPTYPLETPFANVEVQDISDDGQSLLVTSFSGTVEKGGKPLWILPVRGGTPHQVGDMLCDSARWSPDNRQIACINGASIFLCDSDGAHAHIIHAFSLTPRTLLWSSDGKKLWTVLMDYAARSEAPWELDIAKSNSSAITPRKLPFGKECCGTWSWTPDGKNLVYDKREVNGQSEIFIAQRHGSEISESRLSIRMSEIGDIATGRNNHEFFMLSADPNRGELLKYDSRSRTFQAFLLGLSADCLSFSRDGQWMTYVSPRDQSLWRSRIDGSDSIRLSKPPMETEFSAWSPDGHQIAFMGKEPAKPWRIFLVDRDGGPLKEAARGTDGQGAPTWSADGKALIYGNISCEETHSCWIRRVDLATGMEEVLPDTNGFRTARWSPSGDFIAALKPQTRELMLFDVKTKHWTSIADSITGDNLNWSNDSQYLYVDTLQSTHTLIIQLRVRDKQRQAVADLTPLKKGLGQLDYWIGIAPDNSPLMLHQFTASEVYKIEWLSE